MAKNLKKFVNPKFIRTVDPSLLSRLLERHQNVMLGFDFAALRGDPEIARAKLQDYFTRADEDHADGLVADLHRIAELGDADGLRLILDQASRLGVEITPGRDPDGGERCQDPKHVALSVFLEHPMVFDAASDMLAMTVRTSLAEYAGAAEGIEAGISDSTKAGFERAAAAMFEADHMGTYCRVGWYTDGDETNLVITHGSHFRTMPVVDRGEEFVASYRAAEHAVLSYAAATGRLKIGGVPKARQKDVAELFAARMLDRPGFFAAQDAQNLYTLAPIERAGSGFPFTHAYDPGIRQVQIVEAQADHLVPDERSGGMRPAWSVVARDGGENALVRLAQVMRGQSFGPDWRLNHVVIRIHFDTGAGRPTKVAVKIKPPAGAIFKRHRFEDRIMTLLRRNGLCHDRYSDSTAIAAE